MQDPYRVLNVSRRPIRRRSSRPIASSPRACIPTAIRAMPRAEQRFKEVTQAYELLSDPAKRAQFDRGEIDADGRPVRLRLRLRSARRPDRGPGGAGRCQGGVSGRRRAVREDLRRRVRVRCPGGGPLGRRAARRGAGGRPARARRRSALSPRGRLPATPRAAAGSGSSSATGRSRSTSRPAPRTAGCCASRARAPRVARRPGRRCAGEIAVRPHPRFSRRARTSISSCRSACPKRSWAPRSPCRRSTARCGSACRPAPTAAARCGSRAGASPAPGAARGDQYVRLLVMLPERPDAELAEYLRRWAEKHPYDPRADLEDA